MIDAHTEIFDYADELISTPRAHLRLELKNENGSFVVTHNTNILLRCKLNKIGTIASGFIAESLGVSMPDSGSTISARVSTGVLYRTVGIASLDYQSDASYVLLDRLLSEAEMQRGGASDET
tara:strand:+ start:18927 stop:19292 length:366 start_codon:yes stop_codon:yes gene_type:complete